MDVTGTRYDGPMKDRRMHGKGKFTFSTGSIYEGEFRDGMFHGSGCLTLRNGGKFIGEWRKGVAMEGRYVFADGLAMDDENRPYCLPNLDRRFQSERLKGLKPAGRCQLTNQHPPRTIPPGHYDHGAGFFDPKTKLLVDYDKLLFKEHPKHETQSWIAKNCRKEWDEEVGFFRPDHSKPHPSDRSTYIHPDNKIESVQLPKQYSIGPSIPRRQFEIPLEITRESETAMMDASQAAGEGRRAVRENLLRGLEGATPPAGGSFVDERHSRSQFGSTVGAAALSSATNSASSLDGGFGAVFRRRSRHESMRESKAASRRFARTEELRRSTALMTRPSRSRRTSLSTMWGSEEDEEEEKRKEKERMTLAAEMMMEKPKLQQKGRREKEQEGTGEGRRRATSIWGWREKSPVDEDSD